MSVAPVEVEIEGSATRPIEVEPEGQLKVG